MADSIKNAISEVVASAVAKGNADSNLSDMSYTLERMIGLNYATLTAPNTVEFVMGTVNNCIIIQKLTVLQDVNLSVTYSVSADPRCDRLQMLVNMEQYQIPLQGERIAY